MIIFTAEPEAWHKYQEQSIFATPDLKEEGFIHCCTASQTLWVLNKFHKTADAIVVARICEDRLESEVQYEGASSVEGLFPHVYGPINREAVQEFFVIRQKNGKFETNALLQQWIDEEAR